MGGPVMFVVMAAVVVVFVMFIVLATFFNLWLRASLSGAHVSFVNLIRSLPDPCRRGFVRGGVPLVKLIVERRLGSKRRSV